MDSELTEAKNPLWWYCRGNKTLGNIFSHLNSKKALMCFKGLTLIFEQKYTIHLTKRENIKLYSDRVILKHQGFWFLKYLEYMLIEGFIGK